MPPTIRTATGSRAKAGTGGLPGRDATAGRPRPGGPGPAGVLREPRRPRSMGEQPGAGARRHRPRHPDPADGRIERDPDGSPRGTLHEGAMRLVERLIPPPYGGGRAPRPGEGPGLPPLPGHHGLAGRLGRRRATGRLSHVRGPGAAHRPGGRRPTLGRRARSRAGRRDDRRAAALGAGSPARHEREDFLDGVVENYSAAMLDPYLDRTAGPPNRGHSNVDPDALKGYVTRLDAEGFQVHFHALGDRAVREGLDAIEAARATNGPSDGRPSPGPSPGGRSGRHPALPRSRRDRHDPGALGVPRAPDDGPDDPVPRPGAGGPPVPVREHTMIISSFGCLCGGCDSLPGFSVVACSSNSSSVAVRQRKNDAHLSDFGLLRRDLRPVVDRRPNQIFGLVDACSRRQRHAHRNRCHQNFRREIIHPSRPIPTGSFAPWPGPSTPTRRPSKHCS